VKATSFVKLQSLTKLQHIPSYQTIRAMKTLTIKLDEEILAETRKLAAELNMDRDRYISEALRKFNAINRRRVLKAALQRASKATSTESMSVLCGTSTLTARTYQHAQKVFSVTSFRHASHR